jgi:plasmid segregation protein ParM
MNKCDVIGVDIGYGYSKIVTAERRVMFPSRVGPLKTLTFELSNKDDVLGETVQVGGEIYFVGGKADLCDTTFSLRTRDWVETNIYSALLSSALMRATEVTGLHSEVLVITGLPVAYMRDKAKAEEQVRQTANSLNIRLCGVKVIPQPFGGFFDFVLDETGEPTITQKTRFLGVVDVGHHTTDFVLIKNLRDNLDRASGSITGGVHDIIDGVRRDIMQKVCRDNVSYTEAEECVRRTRMIKIKGEDRDMSDLVSSRIRNSAQNIIGEIKSRWSQEGEVDLVLLSGGGSILLKEHLKALSHETKLLEGAQYANARGYFKHGLLLSNASRTV